MLALSRRSALICGAAAFAAAPSAAGVFLLDGEFAHGVASGDPDQDSVIIWTRITPLTSAPGGRVKWEVANDEAFREIVAAGEILSGPARDWTAKAVARGLAPGRTYYYRFNAKNASSPVGRTKTLPQGGVDRARFAVVSCSNYAAGFFNVYDLIACEEEIDAVIHLGDYIYEYGGERGAAIGRSHEPPWEVVTLSDYRRRHAQYKADAASRAMHARHPLIAIWDDHEVADNSWKGGANNHDSASEGDWDARRRAALQAYYEWMPVREPDGAPEAFFRHFAYGDLLTLAAFETRLMARDRQIAYSDMRALKTREEVEAFRAEILWDESRNMLGSAQLDYFDRVWSEADARGTTWRIVANQVLMGKVRTPDLTKRFTEEDIADMERTWRSARSFVEFSANRLIIAPDSWDGYPAARERLYDRVRESGGGLIVLTGDTHAWWANDLTDHRGQSMGVELGVHSVSSGAAFARDSYGGKGAEYARLLAQDNDDVRFVSGENHGYIDLHVERDGATAVFRGVDTVQSPAYQSLIHAQFEIERAEGIPAFANVL